MLENGSKDLDGLRIDPARKGGLEPEKTGGGWRWAMGALAIVIVAASAVEIARSFADTPEVEVARVQVERAAAVADAGATVLTAGGYIVAHHTIEVSSKVIGKVVWVGVEKGDRVKVGQVLVRLDDTDYRAQFEQAEANLAALRAKLAEDLAGSRPQEIAAAYAAVQQAQANAKNAALTRHRTQALFHQGIVAQSDLDNAVAQANVAKAQLASAKENYQITKIGPRVEDIEYARAQVAQAQASVDYQKTQLDGTIIRAPVTGTVLERNVEVGELVSNMNFGGSGGVKTSVVTLANLDDLQVEIDVDESDFSRVTMNQRCVITPDSYPDRKYAGQVTEISPEANRQKGTIQVKVKVLHPDDYLRPEMSAHVSFIAPASAKRAAGQDVLTIPASAVSAANGQSSVFVVRDERVKLESVRLGGTLANGRVEVLAGLDANDEVIVQAPAGLKAGERVKAKPSAN